MFAMPAAGKPTLLVMLIVADPMACTPVVVVASGCSVAPEIEPVSVCAASNVPVCGPRTIHPVSPTVSQT